MNAKRFGMWVLCLTTISGCHRAQGIQEPDAAASADADGSVGSTRVTQDWESDEICSNGALYFGPVDLPRAYVGESYDVDLRDWANDDWIGVEYVLHGAGDWLTLPDPKLPIVTGTPTVAGPAPCMVEAIHGLSDDGCSTMPDPHEFTLFVIDGSADNGSSDGGSGNDTAG